MGTINRALVAVSLIAAVALGFTASASAQVNQSYCSATESPDYYPCLPAVTGQMTCSQLTFSVHVVGDDSYSLDADGDGIACEDEHGEPAALPSSAGTSDATPEPTRDLNAVEPVTPAVDATCGAVIFKTETVAPVQIVTPKGNVDKTKTDQGTWKVQKDNQVLFTPVTNATFPTSVNLEGTNDGKKVIITATAECNNGKLVQVGAAPEPTKTADMAATPAPTAAAGSTPAAAPTATPKDDDELAYTGSDSSFLGWLGLSLIVAGVGITIAVSGSKPKNNA